jgi:predicted alpha/beta-hydrolase family hydrolase
MHDYDISQLEIAGHDAPVPNQYWAIGSDTLVVMLPGLGYTNDMPLMFYVQELAVGRRWDVLQVNYEYRGLEGTTKEQRVMRMADDCRAALKTAVARGGHRRVVLVGKSLGTIAMTTLLEGNIEQDVVALWLTPIIKWPEVRNAMIATASTSTVVIGTQDDHFDPAFLDGMQGKGALVDIVDGADHSLDVEAGVGASIGVMRQVIERLDGFLETAVP